MSRQHDTEYATAVRPYRHRGKFFVAAVILQIAFLIGLAVPRLFTMANGRTVTFDTTPVDPWDMFRGDYVTLGYEFSNIPTGEHFKKDQPVYSVLRKEEMKWKAVKAVSTRPSCKADEIFIKGKAQYETHGGTVRVRYGIEQVFVAEGRGKNVKSGDQVKVDAVVDTEGSAVIKEVRANNDVLYRFQMI